MATWVTGIENMRPALKVLLTDEALVLLAVSEDGGVGALVARQESRRLGDGVLVSTPVELDGVANRRVGGEGHHADAVAQSQLPRTVEIAEDALDGLPVCSAGVFGETGDRMDSKGDVGARCNGAVHARAHRGVLGNIA